jgi:hypothetical protein
MCDITDEGVGIDISAADLPGPTTWTVTPVETPPEAITEITVTAQALPPNPNAAQVVLGAALTRAFGAAGAELGEGLYLGLEAGSFLGPLGGVVGAVIGAGIAYYVFTH